MRSIWLVALRNLRRRKGQGLLVGFILGLSVLLFFTGLGVLRTIESPVHLMLERQRASQLTLRFDARIYDPDSIRAWWAGRPEVASVTEAMAAIELQESAFFKGKPLSRSLYVTERPLEDTGQDIIRIVDGRPVDGPGPGEIWLPTSLAADAGIRAGDMIEIPAADGLKPLVVGAVVVDPQFSAQFYSPVRVWVGAGELPSLFQSPRLTEVMVGVRLKTGDTDAIWDKFVRSLGGAFSGSVLDRRAVLAAYTAPYSLMAAMIVAFSALGVFVALFAIQGTITSAILADFKTIGILRAQGFRSRDVRRIYELQYLLLAGSSLTVGVVAGVFVVRRAVGLLTGPVATSLEGGDLFGQAVLTLAVFLLLVYLFVAQVARAAGRIQPSDAIRYGAAAKQATLSAGIPIRRLTWLSVPLIIAVKNLARQKRRAAFVAVAVLFATVAASLAINLDHSFGRMTTHLASFGFDAADVRITRGGHRFSMRHADLMAALKARADVRAVATSDGVDATFPLGPNDSTRVLNGFVVDGDMTGLGYHNLRGRNPVGPREMSLAVRSADELHLHVGDRVNVNLMGASISFDIVGVYQSINNTGHGFRIRMESVRLASPLWSPTQYGVALADGVDREQFIAALEAEYGEAVDAKPGDFYIRDQLASITRGLSMTNSFLAIVFLLAAAVFIFNTTLLGIGENRPIFGILKTAGMTPGQLRSSVVAGVAVQAGVGLAAGVSIWFLAARVALSQMFGTVGLVSFPLENSVVGMATMVPLIFGFCIASAWIPSRWVLDVNPRTLVVE